MNFGNGITGIHSTAQALPVKCPSGSAWMIYQLWQSSCRNCRELRREKIWIVATKLPKMGGKKKVVAEIWRGIKIKKVLRPQYFYNIFTTNYIWLVVISSNLNLTLRLIFNPTITTSNNLPFRICCKNVIKMMRTYHFSKKKQIVEWICSNDITKIEGKKIVEMNLWQWYCQNRREKKIVAIGLWQWHCRNRGKKKFVGVNLW